MDFSHWSANLAALAAYLVVGVIHLLGVRDTAISARRQGRSQPPELLAQAVSFQAGLLLALLAVVSPVGYWSYRFIWVRNLQDVMLAIVAPALIVLSAPWQPLRRGVGRRGQHPGEGAAAGAADATATRTARPGWQVGPVLAAAVFCVVWWVWHLPGPFDAALHSSAIYAAEVVSYLIIGILLWLPWLGIRPLAPLMAPMRTAGLVVAVAAATTVLGLMRTFSPAVAYPAYFGPSHRLLSVISDQQVGGGILWVVPLIPFSVLAIFLVVAWLRDEESGATDADLDRLLRHKSAWPSRPSLR
jgi:cytochrome c oxidase assembly factor CtaG